MLKKCEHQFYIFAQGRGRSNLTVLTRTAVKKVLIGAGRASGVLCETACVEATYGAGEVILATGVYGSPQMLQLSGIGPGAALQKLGIDVLVDSPAVGANLADHQ
ncbi:MAG: GMC family oxidoreductase N-terminal domain-containing protein [Novosphingobium sp.]